MISFDTGNVRASCDIKSGISEDVDQIEGRKLMNAWPDA